MKKILTLLLFLFFVIVGMAQTDSTEIKLQQYKDMFLKGLINSQDYEALKAKALGLNQQQIQKEKPQEKTHAAIDETENSKFSNDSIVQKGFCNITQAGVMIGVSNYSGPLFTFKTIFGKRVNRKLFWGAGLGLDLTKIPSYYKSTLYVNRGYGSASPATLIMVSAFASMRYYFLTKRITPFIGEDIGITYYNMTARDPIIYTDINGSEVGSSKLKRHGAGARANTELGFKYYVSRKVGIGFSLSYMLQHLQVQTSDPGQQVDGNLTTYETATRFYHFLLANFILNFN